MGINPREWESKSGYQELEMYKDALISVAALSSLSQNPTLRGPGVVYSIPEIFSWGPLCRRREF